MKILVIYFQRYEKTIRNTINEHLYSFKRYSEEECYYLNAALGIPWYISKINFDLTIYHYTIFAKKWNLREFNKLLKRWHRLKNISGYKVAIPQDEYIHSDAINDFFKNFKIKTVFTCLPKTEWHKVYPPEKSGIEHYITVFAGYIDENAVKEISSMDGIQRDIDIGYRARKLPYWLGRHGQFKSLLADRFINSGINHKLKVDISTEFDDVLGGADWYNFLLRCRTVLGSEGGASLHDPTGEIRKKVEEYVTKYPKATFEDVEKECFPGQDGNLRLFALSPRHFECCITKTCQVLLEGEYDGIFKPGIHYIEIKKDWSNMEEVIRKIENISYCKKLAENAYRDIVESGLYTYKRFVELILSHVNNVSYYRKETTFTKQKVYLTLLELREKYSIIFLFSFYLFIEILLMFKVDLLAKTVLRIYSTHIKR